MTTPALELSGIEMHYGFVRALDDIDVAGPDYVGIAVHQDDGSWVAQPRVVDVDARTVTLAISPDASGVQSRFASLRWHDTVKLRTTKVLPQRATVKVRQTYSSGKIVDWTGTESSDTPAPLVDGLSSLGGGGTTTLTIIALIVGAIGVVLAIVALVTRGRPLA